MYIQKISRGNKNQNPHFTSSVKVVNTVLNSYQPFEEIFSPRELTAFNEGIKGLKKNRQRDLVLISPVVNNDIIDIGVQIIKKRFGKMFEGDATIKIARKWLALESIDFDAAYQEAINKLKIVQQSNLSKYRT